MRRHPDAGSAPQLAPLTRLPALAPLALLESALEASRHALLAVHPELHACRDEHRHRLPDDQQAVLAAAILTLAGDLALALRLYYRAHCAAADAIPF